MVPTRKIQKSCWWESYSHFCFEFVRLLSHPVFQMTELRTWISNSCTCILYHLRSPNVGIQPGIQLPLHKTTSLWPSASLAKMIPIPKLNWTVNAEPSSPSCTTSSPSPYMEQQTQRAKMLVQFMSFLLQKKSYTPPPSHSNLLNKHLV